MWAYTITDFDPAAGNLEEDWARGRAGEGWQMWTPGHGVWIELGDRRVKRWNLRRPISRPDQPSPDPAAPPGPRV